MNKKVYKMYEAPKMEIVEVELEAMLAESISSGGQTIPEIGGSGAFDDDEE